MLFIPHVLVGGYAWSWFGFHPWICSAIIIHCIWATWTTVQEGRVIVAILLITRNVRDIRDRLPEMCRCVCVHMCMLCVCCACVHLYVCVCDANVNANYSLYFPLCTCYHYSPSHPTHLHTSCSVAVKIMVFNCCRFAYICIAITVVWHITPHFICDVIFYLILWHTFSIHIVFTTVFEFLIYYLFPIRIN